MARSKAKYMKFTGKAIFCMPYRPDEYNDQEFWKTGLAVTKEVAEKIKSAGIQNKLKFSENIPNIDDGTRFFTFKRPTEKKFSEGTAYFCPPVIRDRKGKDIVHYEIDGKKVYQYTEDDDQPERIGEPILIGNGSEIEITLCVYPAGSFGKGSRLESIKIIDLIEYNPDDEEEVEPEDQAEKTEKELNDEIPFGKGGGGDKPSSTNPKKKTNTQVGW